jgi:hypothetical protein
MNLKPQGQQHGQTPVMRNNSNNLIQGGSGTNFKVMNSSDFTGHHLNANNEVLIAAGPTPGMAII